MFHHLRIRLGMLVAVGAVALMVAAGAAGASAPGAVSAGLGVSFSGGITKQFAFEARQTSATTLAASGYASEAVADATGVYGDFTLQGPVACMRVVGTGAVIGITIAKGTGTAVGHVGEALYLYVNDNGGTTPDTFDNSGYTGTSTLDCASQTTHQGAPVVVGRIRVRG